MNASGLQDRGIGFQALGFALVGCACVAILTLFSGSDHLAYKAFEIATTKLHWAFVILLAVTFDKGRDMFEKAQAIREAKKAQIREEGRAEGREEGITQGIAQGFSEGRVHENARFRALLDQHDISLPPDVVDEMFGGQRKGRS